MMKRTIEADISLLREALGADYRGMFREPGGVFRHPFLTPGSQSYADVLWDWDSWWSNIALRQILLDSGDEGAVQEAETYERGNILNFLDFAHPMTGWVPIVVGRDHPAPYIPKENTLNENMHKPCLAQHAAFLVREAGGNAAWLRGSIETLMRFINCYHNHYRHLATGLFYWKTDNAIGVDDDPCTYGRPENSSASFYLNAMMLKEYEALVYLLEAVSLGDVAAQYRRDGEALRAAIREHCWDEWTGFFYSCDINLKSREGLTEAMAAGEGFVLHLGMPRSWDCLIQRIGVWSGFLALWAGIATAEQADRIVAEHFANERTYNAPFGIRTLSRMEKMYNLKASGNPSTWLGPVWGISNYMTWSGLVRYGFDAEATELAEKTVRLFAMDLRRFGALHEYYQPENGEPILNRGFQNWNYLVLNMAAWLEGRPRVAEF